MPDALTCAKRLAARAQRQLGDQLDRLRPSKERGAASLIMPQSMEVRMRVELSQLVDDVMRQWPVTIRVFLNYRMRCVGCPIACFHTIENACREHEVDRVRFLADIRAAAATGYVDDPSC